MHDDSQSPAGVASSSSSLSTAAAVSTSQLAAAAALGGGGGGGGGAGGAGGPGGTEGGSGSGGGSLAAVWFSLRQYGCHNRPPTGERPSSNGAENVSTALFLDAAAWIRISLSLCLSAMPSSSALICWLRSRFRYEKNGNFC